MRSALLLACALLVVIDTAEAQGRKGKGKKPRQRPAQAAAKDSRNSLPSPLPGFDQPAKGAGKKKGQSGKTAGAKPQGNAKKPAATKPPDAMKEADQVTTAADDRLRLDQEQQKLLREHFRLCDLDGNGWISLREAEVTLSFDRAEYGRADKNRDGRVVSAEFAAQKDVVLARLGAAARPTVAAASPAAVEPKEPVAEPAVAPPRKPRSGLRALYPRPADLLGRYDEDGSKGLDVNEVEKLCTEVGLELSSAQVVESMDRNETRQLEPGELLFIASQASRHMPESLRPDRPGAAAGTPGAAEAHPAEPDSAEAPRRPPAPTHFARLDPDGDGWITEADLRALQSPARLDVRLKSVLSAMDGDGDGRLSESEFRASMGRGTR